MNKQVEGRKTTLFGQKKPRYLSSTADNSTTEKTFGGEDKAMLPKSSLHLTIPGNSIGGSIEIKYAGWDRVITAVPPKLLTVTVDGDYEGEHLKIGMHMADPNGHIKCFAKIVKIYRHHLSGLNSQDAKLEALFHAFEVISHTYLGRFNVDIFCEFLDQKVVEGIEKGETSIGRHTGVIHRIQDKLQGSQLAGMKFAYHTEEQRVPIAKMLGSRGLYHALNCGKPGYLQCRPDHLGPDINQQQGERPARLEDLYAQQNDMEFESFHAAFQEDPNDLPWDWIGNYV